MMRSLRRVALAGQRRTGSVSVLLVALFFASAGNMAGRIGQPASAIHGLTYHLQRSLIGLDISPSAIAVNRAGDIFIADANHDRVVEIRVGSQREIVLPFVGLQHPTAVAVDSAGDVFTTDLVSESVLELPAGGAAQRRLPVRGLMSPTGIAVDAKGDVFVSDTEAKDVVELPAGAAISHVMTQFTGLIEPSAVAVDSRDDLFVGEMGGISIDELPAGASAPVSDFLDIPVTALAVDSLGDIYFTSYGSSHVAWELPAGTTKDPTPLPLGSLGEANGIAVDAAGVVYVGIPDGDELARIARGAATYTTLPLPGLGAGSGIAVNAHGDVFVADAEKNDIVKLTPLGQQSVVADFNGPNGGLGELAVDAAGDIYIAEYYYGFSELTSGGELVNTSFGGTGGTTGIAVSSTGSVYYALGGYIMRYVAGQAGYVGAQQPFGDLDEPQYLSIDSAGDLFVTDKGDDRVLELRSGTTAPITLPFSGLSGPTGIAVDAAGDVFVVDTGNNRVLELRAGSSHQVVLPFSDLDRPVGIALDSSGDVYVDDNRLGLVELVATPGSAPRATTATA